MSRKVTHNLYTSALVSRNAWETCLICLAPNHSQERGEEASKSYIPLPQAEGNPSIPAHQLVS